MSITDDDRTNSNKPSSSCNTASDKSYLFVITNSQSDENEDIEDNYWGAFNWASDAATTAASVWWQKDDESSWSSASSGTDYDFTSSAKVYVYASATETVTVTAMSGAAWIQMGAAFLMALIAFLF